MLRRMLYNTCVQSRTLGTSHFKARFNCHRKLAFCHKVGCKSQMTPKLYAYSETRNVPPMTNISLGQQMSFNFVQRLWYHVLRKWRSIIESWSTQIAGEIHFLTLCFVLNKRISNSFSRVHNVRKWISPAICVDQLSIIDRHLRNTWYQRRCTKLKDICWPKLIFVMGGTFLVSEYAYNLGVIWDLQPTLWQNANFLWQLNLALKCDVPNVRLCTHVLYNIRRSMSWQHSTEKRQTNILCQSFLFTFLRHNWWCNIHQNPLWLPQVLNQGLSHQCTCFCHVRRGALS
jgi:hypothetical protein